MRREESGGKRRNRSREKEVGGQRGVISQRILPPLNRNYNNTRQKGKGGKEESNNICVSKLLQRPNCTRPRGEKKPKEANNEKPGADCWLVVARGVERP